MANYKARLIRLRTGEHGAVTTLFIIITAGIVLFGTILIDYARVAALNTITDQAVRGSVRSVLSAYDATLYERYGLFGRGGTPSADLFEKSIRGTLEYGGSGGSYRPVSPAVERFQVDAAAFLGQYGVLKRQIAEEMKIKAPVDFMLEIGTRFGAMSQLAKETAAAADTLATASKLYDERQRQLLRTIALMRDIAALASGPLTGDPAAALAGGYSSYAGTKSNAEALAQSIAAVEALAAAKDSASAKVEEGDSGDDSMEGNQGDPLDADRQKLRAYADELSRYETSLRAGAAELAKEADNARLRGQPLKELAMQSLAEAERLNQAIRQAAAQAESNTAAEYDRVSGAMAESADVDRSAMQDSRTIEGVRGSVQQLALDGTWFVSFRSLLEEQWNELSSLTDAAYMFVNAVQPALSGNNGSGEAMALAAAHLQQRNQAFQQHYVSPGQRIVQREAEINGTEAVATERNNNMRAAEASLNEARGMLTAAAVQASSHEELIQQFDEVHARYTANRLFNSETEEAEKEAKRWADDVNEQAESSVRLTGSLFDGLADMLAGVSDAFYTGEYVVNRFRSYAPHLNAAASKANNNGTSTAVIPPYSFADQEVEYVLYGFHSPLANVTAALAEIFALRFAIRLTEGFIECRALSHPLLILSGAMLYAARHAAADMAELMQRGMTKLSKYLNVDIKYTDYLRLFMLLHGGGNPRLSRIAAVIETNTGTDLSRTPSAVTASADVSMKLLFLPGAMRLLGTFGLLDGRVANGRFETTKMAALSYS